MKVLWYSHISLKQDVNGIFFYPGGNWINSLKELFSNETDIELGVVFWGDNDLYFTDDQGIKYFQLGKKKTSKFVNFYNNWCHQIGSEYEIEKLLSPIKDFTPDIIHIFGTETILGEITKHTSIPVVIHLQGIISPCLNAWFFPNFKGFMFLKSLNWLYFARGVGFFHNYFKFKKMAQREKIIFKSCTNFIGRTHWDKAITKLFAPSAKYYHCDEVIRTSFYNAKWEMPKSDNFIISSTLNADIYKGLDLILKTAVLLKQHTTLNFIWNIHGIKPDSEYANLVQNLIGQKFTNNNVVLKGVTLEKELLKELLKSNLFIHASYIDNSPNSVCEAQLIGLPVISTNVGGISTLIQDGINGFLVPTNEPHILACRIIELINNPNKLMTISSNANLVAHKRHDKIIIKNNLLSIYKIIIDGSDN
jgi:glycosyltransferase involved in cell wall biosynthesis